MPDNVLIFVTNCADPNREAEFNHWYTNIHFQDILQLPGFKAATRYQLLGDPAGKGKYLAIYEIEGDLQAAMQALEEARPKWAAAGRLFDAIEIVYNGAYSPITQRISAGQPSPTT